MSENTGAALASGCGCGADDPAALERGTLRMLLAINASMFAAEGVIGWWADSTGLLADALDMSADAAVYGVALYAVARSHALQSTAAAISGAVQIALGAGVLAEVARRALLGSEPVSILMMATGTAALLANLLCLALIAPHRGGGVHMRASWIFSANDVIANAGVIVAGGLVTALGTRLPDLVIGALIAAVVVRGGLRILREACAAPTDPQETP